METDGRGTLAADYWAKACEDIPDGVDYVVVHTGAFSDYFRPVDGATYCDMLTSCDKHEWSSDPTNAKSWVVPPYHSPKDGLLGGSDEWSILKRLDGRTQVASWGATALPGGCCMVTLDDLAPGYGKPFEMSFKLAASPSASPSPSAFHHPYHTLEDDVTSLISFLKSANHAVIF